jgi:hypothetical protein
VFRWPVELTPLSLGSQGQPRAATLEVTPRGALFTLAALSHVGHPAHLALIDAYLKGQVRLSSTTGIGEDSRIVASSLAAPLLAASELGVERLTLADVHLRSRGASTSEFADRAVDGRPIFGPDSPRLLLRADGLWHAVHGAERFEAPGCLGTRGVGLADQWHRVIAELPDAEAVAATDRSGRWSAPLLAEVRAPSGEVYRVDDSLVAHLRVESRGRLHPVATTNNLSDLAAFLTDRMNARRPVQATLVWHNWHVDVRLTPDADGHQTLWLLPPPDVEPAGLFEGMRDLAWEIIEGLIARPLAERRSEPIALRLVGQDGRTTTLDVGASVVIVRNQTVFAAWVGSDGRVMVKLLPPGGMPTR